MVPYVMLGGIPIVIEAGPVQQRYVRGNEGRSRVRLSRGAQVTMRHWEKTTISLSGSGWMGPGLSSLNFDEPIELRCTQPQTVSGIELVYTLISRPRPDFSPWAEARVEGVWQRTAVDLEDLTATVTAVPGASLYRVSWMPVFWVNMDPPEEGMDGASGGAFDWTITAEEA